MENREKAEVSSTGVGTSTLWTVDLVLRFIVFAASLVAVLVLGISKETTFFAEITHTTRIKYFPALIYFELALSVAGFYAIITMIVSFMATKKSTPSNMILLLFAVFDALMAGIVASATGSSASFRYLALNGNSHLGWIKISNLYGKFCRYIAAASGVSLFESLVFVLLVSCLVYSLCRVIGFLSKVKPLLGVPK